MPCRRPWRGGGRRTRAPGGCHRTGRYTMNAGFVAVIVGALFPLGAAVNGAAAAGGSAATADRPSAAEIRTAIDRGEYTSAVKMASQALRERGGAHRAERYDLLMR